MKFLINDKPVESQHKNCFVVEVNVMYGDADGYGKVNVAGFRKDCEVSQAHMEDLIQTLEKMEKAYPHGRGGYDTYDHVEGFLKWFGGEILDEFEEWYNGLPEWQQRFYLNDWPRDPSGDGIQSSIEDYKVFYYDENGAKYEVRVTK